MKRKLGRIFARVSGVLKRVWRWVFPAPIRTETQLDVPRPGERAPTVTPEVVDLEWEEIRAALAAEPSVNAAAPEARRTVLRAMVSEPVEQRPAEPKPVVAEPVVPEPVAVAAPTIIPDEPTTPDYYKAPKYGREPPPKMAAPRPKPRNVEKHAEPVAEAKSSDFADATVADLIARVDMFLNMGELPVAKPEDVDAVEPELLVEEPTVRQQVVEQLIAEAQPAEEQPAEEQAVEDTVVAAPLVAAAGVEDPVVEEPVNEVAPAVEAAVVAAPVVEDPVVEVAPVVEAAVVAAPVVEEPVVEVAPVVEAAGVAAPVVEEPVVEVAPVVVDVAPVEEPAFGTTALDEALDARFVVVEETSQHAAADEAVSVAEAVDAPVEELYSSMVDAVASETVSVAADAELVASSTSEATEEAARADEPVMDATADEPEAFVTADAPHEALHAWSDALNEASPHRRGEDEAVAAEEISAPVVEAAAVAMPVVEEPGEQPEPVESQLDEAVDEPFYTTEETSQYAASDEAVSVAEAVDAPVENVHEDAAFAVATETVSIAAEAELGPSSTAESAEEGAKADEQVAVEAAAQDAVAVEEPVVAQSDALAVDAASVVEEAVAAVAGEPVLEGDAAMDAELEAAMAQAGDALAAFATQHPEVAGEVSAAVVGEDEPEPVDEPLSPAPVMADPYYEYEEPNGEGESPIARGEGDSEEARADSESEASIGDAALGDAALTDDLALVEGDVSPEVAAMVAEDVALGDDPTIDAVTEAVEETLAAAADTLEAAGDAMADMPADADALAAAAMADVVAAAEAAEEGPPTPVPMPAFRNAIPAVEVPNDYVATPESMHALYQLNLSGFEGPLDLLLHLIKRHHVDIFDIPVAFICERYLEYIKAMEDLDIDVASEFLFMASELLHLKSRMLLPRPEGEAVEEEETDPRAELVRRLLEYQKYKDVAERFGGLDRFGRDTFGRDPEPQPAPEGEAPLKEIGLFALAKAFQSVLDRQKPEVRHQVMLEQHSVRKRIRALVQRFESQEPMSFESLLEGMQRRIDIVVTFLALLEMGKLKLLRIFQSEDGVIYVHPKFDDVSLAFARLEGMDESQYAG